MGDWGINTIKNFVIYRIDTISHAAEHSMKIMFWADIEAQQCCGWKFDVCLEPKQHAIYSTICKSISNFFDSLFCIHVKLYISLISCIGSTIYYKRTFSYSIVNFLIKLFPSSLGAKETITFSSQPSAFHCLTLMQFSNKTFWQMLCLWVFSIIVVTHICHKDSSCNKR